MNARSHGMLGLSAGLLIALTAAGCGGGGEGGSSSEARAETPKSQAPPATSTANPQRSYQAAPDFELEDVAGGTLALSSMKGKVILLDFWATWCGPCKRGIPHLNDLYAEYKGDGFEIVGISVDQGGRGVSGVDRVRSFTRQTRIDYPLAMATAKTVSDYGGIRSIPTAFLVDRDGKIRRKYVGLQPKQVFEKDVKELLAEEPAEEEAI